MLLDTSDDVARRVDAALAALTGESPLPLEVSADPAAVGTATVELRWREPSLHQHGPRWPGPGGGAGSTWPSSDPGGAAGSGPGLLVGLGTPPAGSADAPAAEPWLVAGLAAGACLDRDVVLLPPASGPPPDDAAAAALGCGLAAGLLGTSADAPATDPPVVHLTGDLAPLLPAVRRGLAEGAAVHLARLLTSAPPGTATPARTAAWAQRGAAAAGVDCEVLDEHQLAEGGYGAVLAVGAGSAEAPRLVRLRWRGAGERVDLAVVGKGVTFDSGGLSLKSAAAMQSMRSDCAGAAAALAVVLALAARRAPVTVEALLPLAENLPGPGAVRPGDVVTTRSGRRVQVLDTDFEGRVLMADALIAALEGAPASADREPPRLLVDVATLTYAAPVALGDEVGALLARDDAAAAVVLDAARTAGEPLWRLPVAERYRDQVDLGWAVRNHPLHERGRAITAALFLGEFVPRAQPWVHLDVAGPAWRGDASAEGATGFGVRTLLEVARQLEG
ncbi:leucyl aminopeptidase [Streptomyces sp. NP160]|uniref:leucyl aminopeptidase n=1 Tax=Streptomyces sp. NP160 TaxID=2586637 RepID=UPI001118B174|nr:leucyl aminopeptidase [Streptomyces sp. NP160]TNM60190.1 leucyl aminopeptidase [Streptomyces sp. NP160]